MAAGKYDITIEQGATYRQQLIWKDNVDNPINLTGYTARLHARAAVAATIPFLILTTENGGITLGGPLGTILLSASPAVTSAIIDRKGVYDLELVSATGDVTRLLEGKMFVKPEVTR